MESDKDLNPNLLTMCMQPDEGTHLRFKVKVPSQGMTMRSEDMEFPYEDAVLNHAIADAYERLLLDALQGDSVLFIRSDHIVEAWRIVDPLFQACESVTTPTRKSYAQALGARRPLARYWRRTATRGSPSVGPTTMNPDAPHA